jgi:SAM-dependent methyltransferase
MPLPFEIPPVDLLACPVCQGSLTRNDQRLACARCAKAWPLVDGLVDLRPPWSRSRASEWGSRQQLMEEWYRGLAGDVREARRCFVHDYGPLQPLLDDLRGTVLDIGGGTGVARQFLSSHARYVCVDPGDTWLDDSWRHVGDALPGLLSPMAFVRGVGEALPFCDEAFDVALSLWSLNHVANPRRVLEEAHRVLSNRGRLILVLEDMPPRWRDFLSRPGPVVARRRPGLIARKLAVQIGLRRWPVQPDHAAIDQRALRRWLSGRFETVRRAWMGGYLTFDLVKLPARPAEP